jgi:hypothetical protein
MSAKPWPSSFEKTSEDQRDLLLEEPSEQAQFAADWAMVKGEEPPPELRDGIPLMTDVQLKVFAWCDGRIFTSNHIRPSYEGDNIVSMVFMPLAFGALKDMTEDAIRHIGLIWEYLDQAGPRSINGYPIFSSLRFMHKDDWARATLAIKTELDRRENVKV